MKTKLWLLFMCLAAGFFHTCAIDSSGGGPDPATYISSTSIELAGENLDDGIMIENCDEFILAFNRTMRADETEISLMMPNGTSTFTATKDDGSGPVFCWTDGFTVTEGSLVTADGNGPVGLISIRDCGEPLGTRLFEFDITARENITITDCDWYMSMDINADVRHVRAVPLIRITYPAEVDSEKTGVKLDASASAPLYEGVRAPAPSLVSYAWTQTAGPAAALNGENTAVCTFDAPAVAADTELKFRITVIDDAGLTAEGTITVTVTAP